MPKISLCLPQLIKKHWISFKILFQCSYVLFGVQKGFKYFSQLHFLFSTALLRQFHKLQALILLNIAEISKSKLNNRADNKTKKSKRSTNVPKTETQISFSYKTRFLSFFESSNANKTKILTQWILRSLVKLKKRKEKRMNFILCVVRRWIGHNCQLELVYTSTHVLRLKQESGSSACLVYWVGEVSSTSVMGCVVFSIASRRKISCCRCSSFWMRTIRCWMAGARIHDDCSRSSKEARRSS